MGYHITFSHMVFLSPPSVTASYSFLMVVFNDLPVQRLPFSDFVECLSVCVYLMFSHDLIRVIGLWQEYHKGEESSSVTSEGT